MGHSGSTEQAEGVRKGEVGRSSHYNPYKTAMRTICGV